MITSASSANKVVSPTADSRPAFRVDRLGVEGGPAAPTLRADGGRKNKSSRDGIAGDPTPSSRLEYQAPRLELASGATATALPTCALDPPLGTLVTKPELGRVPSAVVALIVPPAVARPESATNPGLGAEDLA